MSKGIKLQTMAPLPAPVRYLAVLKLALPDSPCYAFHSGSGSALGKFHIALVHGFAHLAGDNLFLGPRRMAKSRKRRADEMSLSISEQLRAKKAPQPELRHQLNQ